MADTQKKFWGDKWQSGKIGFHLEQVHLSLADYHSSFFGQGSKRVLVPLCGKTLDLSAIEAWGHRVIGVEFVEQAVSAIFAGRAMSWREHQGLRLASAGSLSVFCADFFRLTPEHTGLIDRVWDRAALVALPPELRPAYVKTLRALLAPGAEILLVALEYDQSKMSGPPFALTEAHLRALFPDAQLNKLADHEQIEREPRFKSRGLSSFRSVTWHLRFDATPSRA